MPLGLPKNSKQRTIRLPLFAPCVGIVRRVGNKNNLIMTKILQVLTEYCGQYVDDIRLSELAATNAPLYARKMYNYLPPAIAKFTMPPEMQEYLLGTESNPNFVEPKYTDYQYIVQTDLTTNTNIVLGTEYIGYELFSAQIKKADAVGNIVYIPANNAQYDSATGTITLSASADEPIVAGTVYEFDFYTDGYFVKDLSNSIMDILGLAFAVVWQNRFAQDWLSMVPKVEDKSFSEQNRANKINADTERLRELRVQLNDAMLRYTENCYYGKYVSLGKRLTIK